MIWYGKGLGGRWRVLVRFYGSAFPRSVLISAASAALTYLLHTYLFEWVRGNWDTVVSYQAFAFVLGVIIVFRTNASYQRYTTARTHAQELSSNLADGCAQLLAFEYGTVSSGLQDDDDENRHRFAQQLLHLASLLHALALQHLRRDWDLSNLVHHVRDVPPPLEGTGKHAHLRWSDFITLRCSSAQRAEYNASLPFPVLGGLGALERRALGAKAAEASARPVTQRTPQSAGKGKLTVSQGDEHKVPMLAARGMGWDDSAAGTAPPARPCSAFCGAEPGEVGDSGAVEDAESGLHPADRVVVAIEGTDAAVPSMVHGASSGDREAHSHSTAADSMSCTPATSCSTTHLSAAAAKEASVEVHGVHVGAVSEGSKPVIDRKPTGLFSSVWSPFRRSGEKLHATGKGLAQPLLGESKALSSGSDASGAWERVDAQVGTGQTDTQPASATASATSPAPPGRYVTVPMASPSHAEVPHVRWPEGTPQGPQQDGASFSAQHTEGARYPRGLLLPVPEAWKIHHAAQRPGARARAALGGDVSSHTAVMALGLGTTGWGYVPGPAEAVNVVHTWLYQLTTCRKYQQGGLRVDAPVLAQAYAALGRSYAAFEACRTLVETPFPWPWAQVMLVLLLFYCFSLPLVVVSHVGNSLVAMVVDFLAVSTYWTIDEVARDLEDPFAYDPNDIPLCLMQYQLNERLLQAAGAARGGLPSQLGELQADDWADLGEDIPCVLLPSDTRQPASRLLQVAASFARAPSAIDM